VIVTVVTPTLNGIEFLKECMESVRQQESRRVSVEHVIVDAGSVDGTVELAESYGLRVMKGKARGIFDARFNKVKDTTFTGAMGGLRQRCRTREVSGPASVARAGTTA